MIGKKIKVVNYVETLEVVDKIIIPYVVRKYSTQHNAAVNGMNFTDDDNKLAEIGITAYVVKNEKGSIWIIEPNAIEKIL